MLSSRQNKRGQRRVTEPIPLNILFEPFSEGVVAPDRAEEQDLPMAGESNPQSQAHPTLVNAPAERAQT